MPFYRIRAKWPPAWGDFGRLIVHGYQTSDIPYKKNVDYLTRTGPTVPPITLPGVNVVFVTDLLRQKLESSFFVPCKFTPVIPTHVPEIPIWDIGQEELPVHIPVDFSGSLDNWLEEASHSPVAAEALGKIWNWEISVGAIANVPNIDDVVHSPRHIIVDTTTWNGQHFFNLKISERPKAAGYLAADEEGMKWLKENCDGALLFEKLFNT